MKYKIDIVLALVVAFTLFGAEAKQEIIIDGEINALEWQNAQVFEEYVQSFPNTGEKPSYSTKTYLASDNEGIYVAFENYQPKRSRKYSGHDQFTSADFNMVFIDFNNDGDTAYEFVATLGGGTMDGTYSRGNQSSRDWDGDWQVRVSEKGDYWYSEFFIPWTTGTYQSIDQDIRQIGVYFQRFNVVASQAYSYPDTSRGRKNFTYEFAPVTVVSAKGQSIRPQVYVTNTYDALDSKNTLNAGLDFTWKPVANQQLSATINPDFGQVESDELIVNYSAVETLRTDKRPFFTVNQSLFDVQGPNNLKLVNTRRIGANAENTPRQLHDIEAAIKYVFNGNKANAGLLLAKEGDVLNDQGKDFASLRWYSSIDKFSFGQLVNYVSSPSHDRTSIVVNQDVSYRLNDKFNISSNLLYSQNKVSQESEEGVGATFKSSFVPVRNWENNLEWTYLDKKLDVNDLGYMQRNNISTVKVNSQYGYHQFATTSPISRTQVYGEYQYQRNLSGSTLRDSLYLSYVVQLKSKDVFRVGTNQTFAGNDDLLTRQMGIVKLPAQKEFHLYYGSPSPARFSFNTRFDVLQEGESNWAKKASLNTTTYFTDSIRLNLNFTYIDSDDWLIGNGEGQVNRYSRDFNKVYAKLIARLSDSSDITTTTQWYGLKAKGIESDNPMYLQGENFNVSRFAFQTRYRKTFTNGSSLYVVYSHNGFYNELEPEDRFFDMAKSAIANPEQKSLTVKLNWVF